MFPRCLRVAFRLYYSQIVRKYVFGFNLLHENTVKLCGIGS